MQKSLNTDREIRGARNSGKHTIEIPITKAEGLVLSVGPLRKDGTHGKRWVYRYKRPVRGRQRRFRVPVGLYPQMPLEAARRTARALAEQVADGEMPGLEKRAGTFTDFLADYLEAQSHLARIDERERELRKDAIPVIGNMRPADISPADVDRVITPILQRGAKHIAYRVAAGLKAMFNYALLDAPALAEKYEITSNPASGFGRRRRGAYGRVTASQPRKRFLSDEEIVAWWKSVEWSDMAPLSRSGLKLILLTGQRPGDVRQTLREHVDLSNGTWRIPKTKTGAAQIVYLSKQAAEEFDFVLNAGATKLLFPHPSNKREPVSGQVWPMAMKHLFQQWIVDMERATPHDLRRTMATGLGRLGIAQHIIDACQARAPKTIGETTYNHHDYIPEKIEAWNRWGEHVAKITKKNKPQTKTEKNNKNSPLLLWSA